MTQIKQLSPVSQIAVSDGLPLEQSDGVTRYMTVAQLAAAGIGTAVPVPASNNELNMIRINAAGTGYEVRTPTQVLSDLTGGTGVLPLANGGTGQTTASAALTALGGAALAGNASQVFSVAAATAASNAPQFGQVSRNGSDGTNVVVLSASATLTAAQSGSTILSTGLTSAATYTLPTNARGLNYSIYGNGSYTVTITAPAGNIYLPDGTFAASYVIPVGYEQEIYLIADGINWRAITTGQVYASNVVGTVAGGNAPAGSVGEYITATGTATTLTTGSTSNLTSISLTPGDWDVFGSVLLGTSAGFSSAYIGVTTTSATLIAAPTNGQTFAIAQGGSAIFGTSSFPVGPSRFNITATTTVYLAGQVVFSSGTNTGTGFIRARRVR